MLSKINKQRQNRNLKVNMVLLAEYSHGSGKTAKYMEKNFKTEYAVILQTTDLANYYSDVSHKILREMDELYARSSNWTLKRIKSLELRVNRYNPLRGSSYIDLPKFIKGKKAIINVKNEDTKCFLWSILLALHLVEENGERVSKYIKMSLTKYLKIWNSHLH